MGKLSLKIGAKAYPLQFGYASMRRLGELLSIETYDGTAQKIAKVFEALAKQEKEGEMLPFEVLDVLGAMLLSAIDGDDVPKHAELVDVALTSPEKLGPIMMAWADSMPKPKKTAAPQKKRTTRPKVTP